MHMRRIDKKGFTLIELIITVAVVAIISVPLLQYFSDAAKHNAKSKVQQNAIIAAQNALEELKAEKGDITKPSTLVATSGAVSASAISRGWQLQSVDHSTGNYEITRSCTVNGSSYKVKAEIKPVKQFTNASGAAVTYHEMEVPKMDSSKDIVATEKSTSLVNAQMQFYNWYSSYCDNNKKDKTLGASYFKDKLKKTIYVELKQDVAKPTNAVARIYFRYEFNSSVASYPPGIGSSSTYDDEIVKKSIPANKISDIYIFYTPDSGSTRDSIVLDADTVNLSHLIKNEQLSLFAVSQDISSTNELLVDANSTSGDFFNSVYTNLNSSNIVTGSMSSKFSKSASGEYLMTKRSVKNRIADIEICVYKGDSILPANFCTLVRGSIAQQ